MLAFVVACGEDGDPVMGFALAPGVLDSTGARTAVVPDSDLDTFFQTTRNTGNVVWAGIELEASSGAEAKTFLRFPALEVPSTATILGASLILHADAGGDYGDPIEQDLAVERVTADGWYTNTSQGWPFTHHEATSPPALFAVAACDTPDARISVAVPPSLIAAWVARPDSNFGLAIVPRGPGGWKRFRATRSVVLGEDTYTLAPPELEVRYTIDSETDTLSLALREHATLYSVSPDVAGGTGSEPAALIGGPYDYRAVVRFDLEAVSDDVNLNRLRLRLAIDPSQVAVGQTDSFVTIGAHEVVSLPGENLEPLPVVGFSTLAFARVTLKAGTDEEIVLDVSALGPRIEKGVLLKVEQDYPSLICLGFVTREATAGPHPSLEVTYTLPPRIRL
jgi:hypothetical protein